MDARGKSSMLQDLEARRPRTEVDQLNGEIVAIGDKLKVPTPVNAKICALVHAAEAAGAGSPQLSSQQLLAHVRAVYPAVDYNSNQLQLVVLLLLFALVVSWLLRPTRVAL
jgi:hypothetical protein